MPTVQTSADLPPDAREWYKRHLANLVREIVRKHAPITVGAVHELANGLIVRHGVVDAWKFV